MDNIREAPLDVLACEREPTHALGTVQPEAMLLLFRPDTGQLAVASENLGDLFDASANSLIGCRLDRFFCPEDCTILQSTLAGRAEPFSRAYRLNNGAMVWGHAFRTEGLLGLELTPLESESPELAASSLRSMDVLEEIGQLTNRMLDERSLDIKTLGSVFANRFRMVSGFDRVMMYRFDCDWNGEVIAESSRADLDETYLGHWFPSSDIPRQARDLFLRNRVRPIVDVQATPVPLTSALNPLTLSPVDLSDCTLRAAAPVHVEYLRNMGVRATFTVALITSGRLWGLITCHHYESAKNLGPRLTATCRLLGQTMSSCLSRLLDRREMEAISEARLVARRLRDAVSNAPSVTSTEAFIPDHATFLLSLLECEGLALLSADRLMLVGETPSEKTIRDLHRAAHLWLDQIGRDSLATNHACGHWPELAEGLTEKAAGVIAIRGDDRLSMLLAFRKARPAVISWAGNPYKHQPRSDSPARLEPRKSFDLWLEKTQDRALPWYPESIALVQVVKAALAEVDWIIKHRVAADKLLLAKSAAERAEAEMKHRAMHDALTGLPNRRYLGEQLDKLISRAPTSDCHVALLHIDLDRFKPINDLLGHPVGDKVLCRVADILRRIIRRDDIAARVGGDEFIVLCETGTEIAGMTMIAQRIIDEISRPFEIEGSTCRMGASIGIARETLGRLDCETLMARADIALYDAKRAGRGRWSLFTEAMERQVTAANSLRDDIQRGIEADEFYAVYHPQFDARTLQIVGVEALARWKHPEQGILAPDAFLAAAEELGVIDAIDGAILKCAVRDHADWTRSGHVIPKISVNVSARRLRDRNLIDIIRGLAFPRGVIVFELLESIDLDEPDACSAWNLDALRELGVRIEIDDFGTGRTSIISLVRLKPDRLKIDRQLVSPIIDSESALNLVVSIIDIGRTLGIGVTAEGVETMAHAEKLRDIGCEILQGFAFSKPLDARGLGQFLASQAWRAA